MIDLLNDGLDPNIIHRKTKSTPLHVAVSNKHNDIVRQLIRLGGANINSLDRFLNTPLHNAVLYHNYDAVEELLKEGANIELCKNDWNTPLCIATKIGNIKSIRLLLDSGANRGRLSAILMAAEKGKMECLGEFINRGMDINELNLALDKASNAWHVECVTLLIEAGASADVSS